VEHLLQALMGRSDFTTSEEAIMQRIDEGPIAADVGRYVQGVQFPVLKDTLFRAFRHNGAPDEVVARLSTLPVTEFRDLDHLKREYDAARELEPNQRDV
jgi:hypothetical protein